ARGACSESETVLVAALLGGRAAFRELETELDAGDWAGLPAGSVLDALLEVFRAGDEPSSAALLDRLEGAREREVLGRIAVLGRSATPAEGRAALQAIRAARYRSELRAIQARIPR